MSVQCVRALSMIITDHGDEYKLQSGKTLFSMSSRYNSTKNDPWTISYMMNETINRMYKVHRPTLGA